jgi:type IV fimbrial biogenesis protein FimT
MKPSHLDNRYSEHPGSLRTDAVRTRRDVDVNSVTQSRSPEPLTGGFTLIELLVAIVVLAVLVTIAAPSFSSMVANNRATAAANELLGTLQFARSEAVKLNRDITVCGGSEINCDSPTVNWENGWVVLRGGTLLRVRDAFPTGVEITGPQQLAFRPAGNVDLTEGNSLSFDVRATAGSGTCRNLALTASGRSSVSTVPCP